MRAKQLEREVVESRNLARLRTKAKALCKERDAASAKDASCPGCVKLCRCCGPQHRSKTCVRPVGETCNGCRCDLGLISQSPSVLPPDQQLGDAVMLEMRALPRLSMTLLNVRANLPERAWRLNFWHGPSNHKTVNQTEQLTQAVARGTLRPRPYYQILKALGRPTSKGSQLDYRVHDNFMKSTTFWAHPSLDRPLIILFEPDVVLCPSRQWSARLQDFYGYAFVGAPWPNDNHWCYDLDECVGNSGLSLWRRDVIAAVLGARSLAEYGPWLRTTSQLWMYYYNSDERTGIVDSVGPEHDQSASNPTSRGSRGRALAGSCGHADPQGGPAKPRPPEAPLGPRLVPSDRSVSTPGS